MKKIVVLSLMCLLPVSAKELWLIGGGERVCSSVDLQYCTPEKLNEAKQYFNAHEALFEKTMQFSREKFDQLAALKNWAGGETHQQQVLNALQALTATLSDRLWLETDWHRLLKDMPVSEDEAQLIDDVFEVRVNDAHGQAKRIHVYLPGSPLSARQTFDGFVASAQVFAKQKQHQKPQIVIFTASSYNVFEYVDYYLDLFRQAGTEPFWLPIEPGFIRVDNCRQLDQKRFEMNGAYARAERFPQWARYQQQMCEHPEKLAALLENADGFFLNGGDQSLTMRSLQRDVGQFTPLAKTFLQKVNDGVPLAGTSAGTAVQSGRRDGRVPMISDGTTFQALRSGALAAEINAPLCPMSQRCNLNVASGQLTYRPLGGLQTFTLGVMDTHFYQREREGRLLRLLSDTQTAFGFGVDEATVLRVKFIDDDNADLEVWGEDGVWIADARAAETQRTPRQWQAQHIRVTRLLAGDKASFRDGVLSAVICEQKQLKLPDSSIDASAYQDKDGRQWRREQGAAISACQRADGRWRYVNMPITLQQSLDSEKTK